MIIRLCLSILSISFFAATLDGQTVKKLDPVAIYDRSLPAVVSIVCVKPGNKSVLGSGVVLRKDRVTATNYHVCGDAISAGVRFNNGDIYDDVALLDVDERKDIAILKIKAMNLPFLQMADSDSVRIGSNIYAIGAPRGLEGTISAGIVSGIRPADQFGGGINGFRVIQFTAPISPGSSGGPIIDEAGMVVGLVFASRMESQNLNVAIPINYIAPLVNGTGSGRPLVRPTNLTFTNEAPGPSTPTRKSGGLEDLAGTYLGKWASDRYPVAGTLALSVAFNNGNAEVRGVFTGSEYFSQDILNASFSHLGDGIWQMSYKGQKSKISGTGIFKDGGFVGDYKFKKLIWTDVGQWVLQRSR